jgi:hypothetical protein
MCGYRLVIIRIINGLKWLFKFLSKSFGMYMSGLTITDLQLY